MSDPKIETFVRERGQAAARHSRLLATVVAVCAAIAIAASIVVSVLCAIGIATDKGGGHEGPGAAVVFLLILFVAGAVFVLALAQGLAAVLQRRRADRALEALAGPLDAAVEPMRSLRRVALISGVVFFVAALFSLAPLALGPAGLLAPAVILPGALLLWAPALAVGRWLSVELPLFTAKPG
jgi:hypothetical protein